MKKLFFLFLLSLIFSSTKAQYIKEFSQDTSLYIQELNTIFGSTIKENEKIILDSFSAIWDSLDHSKRVDIMQISDFMRQRSCRARPQYFMFITIIQEFYSKNKIELGYDQFIKGYKSFMQNEKTLLKDINNVNESVALLIDQSLIYNSASLSWKFNDLNYSFVYSEGLRIVAKEMDIIGKSAGDSIIIHDANGYFDPAQQQFVGTSAKVYWERAGLARDTVYAELKNFTLDASKPFYKAENVIFYHKKLLDAPAEGALEDRITQIRTPEQAKFPKFVTYQNSYNLNDIVPGVNYKGAIGMEGANLAGTSSGRKNAVVEIYYNDTLRVQMNSKLFLFGSKVVRSNSAEVAIYIENDSIYHPDLVMTYNIGQELLRLTRSKDYNSQGPYSDSYHRIDMSFDELNWVRSEPVMRMQAALGTALGNGQFESYDFFDMEFYESLQGMEYQHPLADLWTYADMIGGNMFSVGAYADYMGKAAYTMRQQLMQLSKQGFVYFNFEDDMVSLRPKLYDYIDASMMQRDYDVIRFVSRTNAGLENAELDLSTKDLTINGIPTIFLSDSQNVALVPLDNKIVMKRNRDFQFDGIIDAGLFKFYGKNFFFEYDNFLINLQNIDSLSISAKTGQKDAYGNALTTSLDNKIQNITGELLIDAPFNKSGLNPFPEYPIFTSREDSYVYFDDKDIQKGVYDKNRFYFQLFPFSIDSLDNFRRDALRMDGTFISADILPPLEMEMSLRPDNSLGFYLTAPEEGIPIFGGKATFYNDLEMSSAGLHGYGSLDYITSTTWSDDFLFHPDSIMTLSRRFLERDSRGAVSYPYVENGVAQVRYYPFDDVMKIKRKETVFKMFDDSIKFGGDLALRPSGLSGTGRLVFPDARFESGNYKFEVQRIKADSAGVKLKKAQSEDFTFITDNVKIDVDLTNREGDFISREDNSLVEFPANLYESRLDQITWFMDKDEVLMMQNKYLPENDLNAGIDSLKVNGPTYLSKHPQQDSLNFIAPLAYFNYGSKIINAEKVALLEIGDSYIFPDQGNVQVLEKATIKPLRKAKLLANTDSRYHFLYDANLVVDSRLHYRGSADYDYTDEFGNVYTVRMSQVEVDTSITSFAYGEVAVADSFRLSPFYDFQGRVRMLATEEFLDFDGGVRLTHDCKVGKHWLKFETRIDPDSIMIPVTEKMQNIDLNNIYAGTLKARDSIHIYPTFLSGRKDYFDRNLTFSSGYLYYNKKGNAYELASISKLQDMSSEGNYLALQTDSCKLYGEGRIDLNLDYGRVSMNTFGNATHDIGENSLDLRLLMGLDFFFSQEALNIFGNELDSLPGLEPVDITTDFYELGLRNMVGTNIADKLQTELGLYGSYAEIPDSMKFSILFNDVNLSWNQQTNSFRYNGKVGIGTIGDVQVNRKVDAYMEFVERGSGDIFDIYLMADDNTWYYLAFSPGALQVLSSNDEFNELILALPEKERKLKSKGKLKSYIFSLSSSRRLSLFLDRFMLTESENEQ